MLFLEKNQRFEVYSILYKRPENSTLANSQCALFFNFLKIRPLNFRALTLPKTGVVLFVHKMFGGKK